VDTQIAQTRAAIDAAEKSQLREETTNRNPTFAWVDAELAKTRSELAAQQARADVLKRTVASYEQQASVLDRQQSVEQDLERQKKTEEDNYLLYKRKQEEARISNALDRSRILNVAIAEPAAVPDLPARSRVFTLLIGLLAAIAASVASATTAEYLNPSLKTPVDVVEYLDVPVLASITPRAR
jgi:capsular polysaccharide biosynthesis protein